MAVKDLSIYILLQLLKCIVGVYEFTTFPIYFAYQRPWRSWEHIVWGAPCVKSNPDSPLIRIKSHPDKIFCGVKTIVEAFKKAVNDHRDKRCFGVRQVLGEEEVMQPDGKVMKKLDLGDYNWMTYKEADIEIDKIARGLLSIGVKPKEPVIIFAETRLEWMLSAQAIFRIGAQVATLYSNLGEEGIVHGVCETEVSTIITSIDLIPKLQKIISRTPKVKYIIYMEGLRCLSLGDFPEHVKIFPFSHLVNLGAQANEEFIFESPGPDDIAIIMYTSGSTGTPKGVMLSHANLMATLVSFSTAIDSDTAENKKFLAVLPLAHVFELSFECLIIGGGGTVVYSSPFTFTDKSTAIKDGQKGDATLIKPGALIGVPLLLDRIRKSVTEVVESKGKFMKGLFEFAIAHNDFWARLGFDSPIMSRIVFGKIRKLVGGEVKYFVTGGAPLSPDTHRFIRTCLGVKLMQGYGMTETTSVGTVSGAEDLSVGRVGAPIKGCYIRLNNWEEGGYRVTDKPHPRGEILIGGASVSLGYYKNEALTNETFFTENGIRWCRSGDIGEIFPDGTIKVIDRKKDLIKLQFGEYVALGKIESELKTCDLVDNVCVIGSSFRTYTIALIVPNRLKLEALAKDMQKESKDFRELCNDPEVIETVRKSLLRHCHKCKLQKFEIPAKIKLCSEEWLPENGLVTSSFKIRRGPIEHFYKVDIELLYNSDVTSQESKGS